MPGVWVVTLAFLACFVTAVPDRAELRSVSGCSLHAFPKLGQALLEPALNRYKNLEVFFGREDDIVLRLLTENREVDRVVLSEDMGAEEVLALLRARGLVLVPREGFVDEIKEEAALAQFESRGDRFVVFQVPALRAVAAKLAERVRGKLATFENSEQQKAVGAWLKTLPQSARFQSALLDFPAVRDQSMITDPL